MPKRMVKTGTSTDAVSKKGVPADVREALNMLYSMRHELPDTMMEPIRDLVENYRDDIHEWDKTGRVPDWNYFRSAINEICDEDGMPHLCETPKSSRMMKVRKTPKKSSRKARNPVKKVATKKRESVALTKPMIEAVLDYQKKRRGLNVMNAQIAHQKLEKICNKSGIDIQDAIYSVRKMVFEDPSSISGYGIDAVKFL